METEHFTVSTKAQNLTLCLASLFQFTDLLPGQFNTVYSDAP
jgi:hypothetical protein